PIADLTDIIPDAQTLRSLPLKIVFRKRLVPLARDGSTLTVATSDAFDLAALDDIRMMTGLRVVPVLAPRDEIEKLIKTHYGLGGDTLDEMADSQGLETATGSEAPDDLLE